MGCHFHLYGTCPGAGCPWAHAWVPKRAGQGLPLTVPFSLRSSLRSSTSTAPLRPVPATGGLPTDSRGWSLPTKWAAPSWLGHQQVGSNVGKFPERAERHLVTCPCCVATHLVVGLMSESTTWAGAHSGDWRGSSSCSMHPQASAFVFKGNYTHTSQFLEWWVRRWQASCSPAILNVHFYSCYSRGKTAGGITEGGGSCFCSFPPSFSFSFPPSYSSSIPFSSFPRTTVAVITSAHISFAKTQLHGCNLNAKEPEKPLAAPLSFFFSEFLFVHFSLFSNFSVYKLFTYSEK